MNDTATPGTQNESNVLHLRPAYALFNPHLRSKLKQAAGPYTEKPEEMVDRFEQELCTTVVTFARQKAEIAGQKVCAWLIQLFR